MRIAVADTLTGAMGAIDGLQEWLAGLAAWLPAGLREIVVLPAVVLLVLAAPRVVVRRVLPWAQHYVVLPATVVVTGTVTAVALVTDFVLARTFRAVRLPLTGVHHTLGDWGVAGPRFAREHIREWVYSSASSLRRSGPEWMLMASVAALVIWDRSWCDRNPVDGCASPIGVWWQDLLAVVPSFSPPWS
ncbi:hypothetical protein Ait01nite_095360 [Actinoplanes italicus]|nr:hypothetical protein Ait01nite_095360 [Actinoplanes italicus]